ncbi:MAG: nucleotidyltransferase family protein [bacterium]|nr:nucleotidyltransferase family protein [bacterium]
MKIQDQIIPVLHRYGVKKASLFGSYARNEQDTSSDIDLLIEPPSDMGLQFIQLKQELEDLLEKKVDLVSFNGLDKYLKPYILQSEKPIL